MSATKKAEILQSVERRLSQFTTKEFEQGRQYLGVEQTRTEITQSVRKEIQRQTSGSTRNK